MTKLTSAAIAALILLATIGCNTRGSGSAGGLPNAQRNQPITQTPIGDVGDIGDLFGGSKNEEDAEELAENGGPEVPGFGSGLGFFLPPLGPQRFGDMARQLELLLGGKEHILRPLGSPGTPARLKVVPEDDPIELSAPVGLYSPMIPLAIFNEGGTPVRIEVETYPEPPFYLSWFDCLGVYCEGGVSYAPEGVGEHEGQVVFRYREPGANTSNTLTLRFKGKGYFRKIAVTPGDGGGPHLKILESGYPHQNFLSDQFIGDPNSRGGLGTTAIGDVTGDTVPDVLVGSGVGTPSAVTIVDGFNGQVVETFPVLDGEVGGGVRVAVGEMTGDNRLDIVVASGKNTAARVQVLNGTNRQVIADFRPYNGAPVGAYVATADINGDYRAEVLIGPGEGGGPILLVYDVARQQLIHSSYAGPQENRDGLALATTYLNNDSIPEILYSYGNGTALVGNLVISPNGASPGLVPFDEWVPFEGFNGLIHVGSAHLGNEDLSPEIMFGAGPRGGPRLSVLDWFLNQIVFNRFVYAETQRGGIFATGF